MKQLLMVVAILGVFASGMAAAEYYQWETDSKTRAYTDSPERIPARYSDDAQKIEEQSLHDYGRTTRVEPRPAPETKPPATDAVEAPSAAQVVVPQTAPTLSLNLAGLKIEVAAGAEPVVVEAGVLLHDENGRLVEHTIVKQGDRILMRVVKPLVQLVD